jgi:hypothetical protein
MEEAVELQSFHRDGELLLLTRWTTPARRDWRELGTVSNASASASASNCSDEVGLQSMTLFKSQDLQI